jgi:AsmA protein
VAGYVGLALACLIAGTLTFLLIAAPVDFVREQLVQQVKAHTGRDLVIAGPTSISLLPRVAVQLADVSLSEPPAMGSGALLTAQVFAIEVPLVSLLSRQFAVTRLMLVRPSIELRVDAEGRRNWNFASPAAAERPAAVPTPVEAEANVRAGARASVGKSFAQLSLENVHISDGTLRHLDERTGTRHEITGIDLALSLADPNSALSSKGSFTWKGETVGFDGKVSPALALLGEQRGRVALSLNGRLGQAAYDGTLLLSAAPALEGKGSLKAPSLRALAAWLERRLADEAGGIEATAAVALESGRLTLAELTASVGAGNWSGNLALETDRGRPHLSGSLRATELDLGRLLMPQQSAASAAVAGEPPALAPPAPAAGPEEQPAGKEPPPAVPGKRHHGPGWSEAPIELSYLSRADADLSLVVDRLRYRNLETGQSQLSLALKDGVAKLTLQEMLLYGGRGRGILSFDASGPLPATSAELALDNVMCRPLLKDALGLEWLTGRGKITLALAGRGQSERAIVEALNGKAELAIGQGEVGGLDIGKLLRAIEQAHFNRLEIAPEDRTPFNELAGSFQVTNGVATTSDLRLVGPHMRVSGSGSTNLPERSVDYVVRLKIAEIAPSEGAVIKVSGLELPLRVIGPWEKLAFKPDLKGIANSEQAGEAIRQIGKNLNTPEVREAVKELFSGDGQQRVKPRELLEKLLKKQ